MFVPACYFMDFQRKPVYVYHVWQLKITGRFQSLFDGFGMKY